MKHLSCKDIGVDCDAVFEADTEDGVMELAHKHAAESHGLDPIPAQVLAKCRVSIVDKKD